LNALLKFLMNYCKSQKEKVKLMREQMLHWRLSKKITSLTVLRRERERERERESVCVW